MSTWEDSEGQNRSSLNIVQRMSISRFLNLLPASQSKREKKVKFNILLGTLEVLKRPDSTGHSDESQ